MSKGVGTFATRSPMEELKEKLAGRRPDHVKKAKCWEAEAATGSHAVLLVRSSVCMMLFTCPVSRLLGIKYLLVVYY